MSWNSTSIEFSFSVSVERTIPTEFQTINLFSKCTGVEPGWNGSCLSGGSSTGSRSLASSLAEPCLDGGRLSTSLSLDTSFVWPKIWDSYLDLMAPMSNSKSSFSTILSKSLLFSSLSEIWIRVSIFCLYLGLNLILSNSKSLSVFLICWVLSSVSSAKSSSLISANISFISSWDKFSSFCSSNKWLISKTPNCPPMSQKVRYFEVLGFHFKLVIFLVLLKNWAMGSLFSDFVSQIITIPSLEATAKYLASKQ